MEFLNVNENGLPKKTTMQHSDALSRNPVNDEPPLRILHLDIGDWVLSAQMADQKIEELKNILSRAPCGDYEREVYENYALRNGRLYPITVRGIQWVVPRGLRRQIVQEAHDKSGHFGVEKTLTKINERFWFPGMSKYVTKYITSCVPCLYKKLSSGQKERYLHPIQKEPIMFHTVHVDHLGPFKRTRRGNMHLIVLVDGFTKFTMLRPTKSTKTKNVLSLLKEAMSIYECPHRIITDKGTAFTAKKFRRFCNANNIHHVEVAVATPRGNDQVERLNRTVLNALATSSENEESWDEAVQMVQFSINNTLNKTTNKTPSELLMGYKPSQCGLAKIIPNLADIGRDLTKLREEAVTRTAEEQGRQKRQFDKKRKPPRLTRSTTKCHYLS